MLLAGGGPACKAKSPPAAGLASASAAAAPVEAPSRCREVGSAVPARIGEVGEGPRDVAPDGEDDELAALPFAPMLGPGIGLGTHFAASGLSTRNGTTEAVLAVVPASGAPGRVVSLSRVHGDVNPPLLSGRGEEIVVAIPDSDAGGGMLRLARLNAAGGAPNLGPQLSAVEHESGAALAWGEKGALLVWSERSERGGLRVAAFDPMQLSTLGSGVGLEGTPDAEAPALVVRPGGFFLTWIAERRAADAGAPRDAGAGDRLLELGARVLMTVALDAAGKPQAAPKAVSGEQAHVVGFDAVALPDGALGLAFRDDDTTPGVESGAIQLARVGADGSVKLGRLEDEDLSAGLPTLLSDAAPGGRLWVAVRSASDTARVGLLAPTGVAIESLTGDRLLRGAEVLAATAGKLLVSRSRGRALELGVLECKP